MAAFEQIGIRRPDAQRSSRCGGRRLRRASRADASALKELAALLQHGNCVETGDGRVDMVTGCASVRLPWLARVICRWAGKGKVETKLAMGSAGRTVYGGQQTG